MRLKTALWVAAYLRRCEIEGVFGVLRRRGAEEAGAVFVRINRLDGTSDLFGPAPQSAFEAAEGTARAFTPSLVALPAADAEVEAYLARETQPELRAVHLVRSTSELLPAMPRFVSAFLEAQFSFSP